MDSDPVRAKAEGREPRLPKRLADPFPDRFEDPAMRKTPQAWLTDCLSSWVDVLSGGTRSKGDPTFWRGDLPWISPKVMTAIHADVTEAFVTGSAIGSGTRLAETGSTLVIVRGMGLHERGRISQARQGVTFDQNVKALVPRKVEPSLLLFSLLNAQEDLLRRVEGEGHGTDRLPTDALVPYPIVLLPLSVQRKLGRIFERINNRIEIARRESRTLAWLRDALLPKLLSGDMRVRALKDTFEWTSS